MSEGILCKDQMTEDVLCREQLSEDALCMDGWMNQAYSRLSTTHGHITDCKLLVCMYWTRLVLV